MMVSGSRARRLRWRWRGRSMPRSVAVMTRSLARREAEAVVNLGDRDAERCAVGEELLPIRVDVRLVAAAAQELEQHLAMAGRRGREQRSLALLGAEPTVDAVVGCGDARGERMRHAGVVVLG